MTLIVLSFGSVSTGSTLQFDTSFDSSSIEVTGSVDKILLVLEDTEVSTRYLDSGEIISIDINVTNKETGRTASRSYQYNIGSNGSFNFNQTTKLNEFDAEDFPENQNTDLDIELTADHTDLERQVTRNTVTIVRSSIDNTSCDTIKQSDSSASSKVYEIDPDGDGGFAPFEVYCEMDENGGGWIRLQLDNDVDKNGDNMFWFSKYDTIETQRSSHGSIGQQFDWSQLKQLSGEGQLNSDFSDDGTTYYPEMNNEITNSNRKVNYEMAGGSNLDYSDAQIQAIRQHVTELSDTTRMFTHTNDDDNCDLNGEVYTRLSNSGSKYHMTPYTSGNQVSKSQYWDETDFSDTEYLLPTYIDYGDYDTSGCSGSIDHMSWGWEQDYILVK